MRTEQDKRFVIQRNPDGTIDGDWAIVCEKIKERNWIRYLDAAYQIDLKTLEDLGRSSIPYMTEENLIEIPVGSIEFVETYLRIHYGYERGIAPVLIPKELQADSYMGRRCSVIHGREAAKEIASQWGVSRLFIKSASKLKCDYAGIYHIADQHWPDDSALFVSEVVNIISEWRTFVYNGRIVGVKNYAADPWTPPDKEFVSAMVQAYRNAPGAYTLDTAVILTPDGSRRTVVLEVHPFVSCGLYGLDIIQIPDMVVKGFRWVMSNVLGA